MARQPLPADNEVPYGDKLRAAINNAQDTADAAIAVVPPVTKTGSFTFDLTQSGKVTDAESASAIVATVPPVSSVAWPAGTVLEVRQTGTGTVSVTNGAGVVLRTPANQGLKTASQWDSIYLSKRGGGAGSSLPTTNLAMRYNADDIVGIQGDPVSSWPESSGNNLPAAVQATAANQPTLLTNAINGHKAVAFNSTSHFLSLTGSALNVVRNKPVVTAFVVYSYPTSQQGARTLLSFSVGTSSASRLVVQQREQSAGKNTLGGRRNDTDSGGFAVGAADTAGTNNVIAGVFNYAATALTLFKNGTKAAENLSFQTAGSTADTASQTGSIGASTLGTAEFFGGRIMEIMIYNEDSVSLRTNVHSYIQNTYGITVSDFAGNADEWVVSNGVA